MAEKSCSSARRTRQIVQPRRLSNCRFATATDFKKFVKARFHYERGKDHSLFVLLIFFALASILTTRFN